MPYKLRKAPNKLLYWVVTIETGKKHSKDPIPMEKAKAQLRILESALHGGGFQFRKEGEQYAIFNDETGEIIKRVNTPSEALHLLKLFRKQGLPKIEKVYEPIEGEEEEVDEGADVTAGADEQYRVQLKLLLDALAPQGRINHQTLFQNLQPFLSLSNPGHAFLIRLFPYLMKVDPDAPLHELAEPIGKLINELEYYLRTPIHKQKAYINFMSGSGKVTQQHLVKLKREQKTIEQKVESYKRKLIRYMRSKGMTHTSQLEPDNKLMKTRRNLIEEYERISREIAKWEAIDENDGDFIEEEEEEPEGSGRKRRGGMMSVNPLVQPTPSPREVVLKAIQSKVDTANSIRATGLTNPDGQKSMEKIMNEVALELAKAGKAAAVKYLNELREPLESRADFKTDDSVSRNKIAREIGLEIKGTGRKRRGGMYSSSGPPSPSTTLPNLRASVVQVANPLRQNEDEYNEDGVPHSERYLRNRRLGLLGVRNPLHRFNQTPAPAPAPVQITNPFRRTTQSVGFPGIAEAVQTGCSILGSCIGTGKKKRCNKCKPPYHDYSKGKASAFVLTCIDPRYTYDVAYYLQHKKELHQDYDLFTLAGASVGATKKEWTKTFFDNLELGLKLHKITEVWCFDHLDCGMYKATFGLKKDLDPKIHIQCMNKLKALIKKKHPKLKFREFMVDAHGHVSSV